MKAIILSGFTHDGPHPALEIHNNTLKIDHYINELKKLKMDIVIVLGDAASDEILQTSALVQSCEIVFDANGYETSKLTNLKAGTRVVRRECLILPITSENIAGEVFNKVNHHYFTKAINLEKQVVRPFTPKCGQMTPADYFLITPYGLKFINNLSEFDELKSPEMVSAVPILNTNINAVFL